MQDAKKRIEEQMETMDDLAAERGMERPIPNADQMERQRNSLSSELKQAQENVHNGSSEFRDAQEEYDKLNRLWDKTMERKNDGELPTPGEIETLKAAVERSRKAADDYLIKKSDVEKPGPKTQKRITAMSRVKENLDLQSRMLGEWEKQLEKKEPEKGYNVLATDTKYLMNQMEAADEGIVGGSREWKEVNKLLKDQEEKWKEYEKKGPDYKMSSKETREMQELNEKMEKAVDRYIQNKAGKDLSPKEQKRLRTMQKVKNHALSQKKKLAGNVKEMVKDAQAMKDLEHLAVYCENPLDSTILVLLLRGASADKRKSLYKQCSKNGVVVESNALRDYEMAPWITQYCSSRGLVIDPDAAALLAEYAGTDLSKIVVETDKLLKNLPEGTGRITAADIEKNVGISREYSIFELTKELSYRNAPKALKVATRIGESPRFAMPMAVSALYTHFLRILKYGALKEKDRYPDRTEIAAALQGVNPFFWKEYDAAVSNYPVRKAMDAISLLCDYDFKGKGGDVGEASPGDLLVELVVKLLNL